MLEWKMYIEFIRNRFEDFGDWKVSSISKRITVKFWSFNRGTALWFLNISAQTLLFLDIEYEFPDYSNKNNFVYDITLMKKYSFITITNIIYIGMYLYRRLEIFSVIVSQDTVSRTTKISDLRDGESRLLGIYCHLMDYLK